MLAAHSVHDPAARSRARDPMGHRNDDTIEDTRARKYSKIPTTSNPPKDQKNPADWRSLQRKSVAVEYANKPLPEWQQTRAENKRKQLEQMRKLGLERPAANGTQLKWQCKRCGATNVPLQPECIGCSKLVDSDDEARGGDGGDSKGNRKSIPPEGCS